jgi:hypothetical protein
MSNLSSFINTFTYLNLFVLLYVILFTISNIVVVVTAVSCANKALVAIKPVTVTKPIPSWTRHAEYYWSYGMAGSHELMGLVWKNESIWTAKIWKNNKLQVIGSSDNVKELMTAVESTFN